MADSTILGRFIWHELLTTDPTAAAGFVERAMGWTMSPWPADPSYTLCAVGKRQVAGIMALPEDAKQMGAHPSWLTYVATPDLDATARQAASLGAKILRAPSDIPTVGRFAVVEDPFGAVFGLYTPNNPSAEAAADVGDFSWHELATTDWRAALTFYQRLFGWNETSSMDMGADGVYQMFGRHGVPLGGMYNKPALMPGPPSWLPYVRVRDVRTLVPTIKRLGGHIINGPIEVPGGDWIAQGLDGQGAVFAVHSLKAVAAPASKARGGRPVKASLKRAVKTAPVRNIAAKKRVLKKATPGKLVKKRSTPRKTTAKQVAGRRASQPRADVPRRGSAQATRSRRRR